MGAHVADQGMTNKPPLESPATVDAGKIVKVVAAKNHLQREARRLLQYRYVTLTLSRATGFVDAELNFEIDSVYASS